MHLHRPLPYHGCCYRRPYHQDVCSRRILAVWHCHQYVLYSYHLLSKAIAANRGVSNQQRLRCCSWIVLPTGVMRCGHGSWVLCFCVDMAEGQGPGGCWRTPCYLCLLSMCVAPIPGRVDLPRQGLASLCLRVHGQPLQLSHATFIFKATQTRSSRVK